MKKIMMLLMTAAALFMAASCQKTLVNNEKENGVLSFGSFSLGLDEAVETKATAASGNYVVIITDADGDEVCRKTYSEVMTEGKISLPA